jgi:hypothetical protein
MSHFENVVSPHTNTPARRHNFFCYCTINSRSPFAVYWLLVQQFRTDPKKTRAQLINDWFIDGNIPTYLKEGGFLDTLNIGGEVGRKAVAPVKTYIATTTFADGGFFGALHSKISGTRAPANLFDDTLAAIGDAAYDFEWLLKKKTPVFNADRKYQLNGGNGAVVGQNREASLRPVQQLVIYLASHLRVAGFDPKKAGIY